RTMITEVNVPPFRYGIPAQQGLENVFLARPGEMLVTYYGVKAARSCSDLLQGMSCDGFTVNDDGYLVWTGPVGLAAKAWGTNTGTTTVRGSQVMWGAPFAGECEDAATGARTASSCAVGNSLPDHSFSFSSNFS